MRKELLGGLWDGRSIEMPDPRPQEILMPYVGKGLELISYLYDQEKDIYKAKREDNE
jgi:hypothetical protein